MPAKSPTTGDQLAEQLMQAIRDAQHAPLLGARDLPILRGLSPYGTFSEPQENVLVRAIGLLRATGRVYAYGNSVVFDTTIAGQGRCLLPLRNGTTIEPTAKRLLSNVMVCADGDEQFPPPDWFVSMLLLAEPLLDHLPRIQTYMRRPAFDANFNLCGPGFHSSEGILVHGPEIEPVIFVPADPNLSAVQRLPIHLRTFLGGFCFRSDADLANTIAILITGLLVNHFIKYGKPIVLIDGNQPDVGKSLLVQAIGVLFDDSVPPDIRYTSDDEELAKLICAALREAATSILHIDNAKNASSVGISSPTIESQSLAPEICLRILGHSSMLRRPNDLIWCITMNKTKACGDIVSRDVPVQLFYDGRTEDRRFEGPNPLDYAREHRIQILGELAGMIIQHNQHGRPDGIRTHRCRHWARLVGGIMQSAGFPEFLSNAQTVAATFNSELDELAALIEVMVAGGGPFMVVGNNPTDTDEV